MNTTNTAKATEQTTPDFDALAKRSVERAGYRPTFVSAGPECMVCEFATEAEARACADGFSKYVGTWVELDSVLGWVCEIDLK